MRTSTYTRTFNGGEMSPEMYGEVLDPKYQSGLATCRNFKIKPHGPAENRTGTQFVAVKRDSESRSRLIPFSFSLAQTLVVEISGAGALPTGGYARFYANGAPLLARTSLTWHSALVCGPGDFVVDNGVFFYCRYATTERPNPDAMEGPWWPLQTYESGKSAYLELPLYGVLDSDVKDIHYVQSADVLTLVHPRWAPITLTRKKNKEGHLTFVKGGVGGLQVLEPTGLTVQPTVGPGGTAHTTYTYVVTSMGLDGLTESSASDPVTCTGNLFSQGGKNTLSWAPTKALYYNVYKMQGGMYGFIGQTDKLTLVDDNIAPDLGTSPPFYSNEGSGWTSKPDGSLVWLPQPTNVPLFSKEFPSAVAYFQQRRVFAGTLDSPQNIWATASGTESSFAYHLPVKDTDRIAFKIAAREVDRILHVVAVRELIVLTSAGEWCISPLNSDALTPYTINARPQSYVGANNAQPVVVGNTIIFAAARGGHLRELGYSHQVGGYANSDLSLRAHHLFDGFDLVDMALQKAPFTIVWAVSSNGKLIGLTYVPEQQVYAFHWHDSFTSGGASRFESCCVVNEDGEDFLYLVVKRQIKGGTVRCIERMASRMPLLIDPKQAFFVDCGVTQTFATPVTTISGLTWLEGETVNILADGAVVPAQKVVRGAITLPYAASVVTIGLPITFDLQTLPLAAQIDSGLSQGRVKNVNRVTLRVLNASSVSVGPDVSHLVPFKQRTNEPWGAPPKYKTDEIDLVLDPSWQSGGQVFVRQTDPLPVTVLGMAIETEIGGG